MPRKRVWRVGAMIALGVLVCCSGAVRASFHEWRIVELYSNASGSVQYIELQQFSSIFDDEKFVGGMSITDMALGHNFTIPQNLPAVPVANQYFLVGTPSYAALGGVPAPDYTLAADNFFSVDADTVSFSFVDSLSFTSGQLPTDGTHALHRAWGDTAFTTPTALPTNFAGATGTVPEPAGLAAAAVLSLALTRRRVALISDVSR